MYIRRSMHTIFIFEKTGKAFKHACIERMKEKKKEKKENVKQAPHQAFRGYVRVS